MVRIVVAAMVVGLVTAAPGRAAESCETLSYAEQEACWPRRLAAQAQQMKKLVEARIRRIGPDEVTDEARRDAFAQVIRRSQAAWETYRDTECGELDHMMRRHIMAAISNCKADLNAARLETLRRNVGP
ncbi:MAG: DUF1311 domain-containing protein [Siculibacillus sp.]|nr:DUF1311 domain-containing protein [Siculibacillus sp.]